MTWFKISVFAFSPRPDQPKITPIVSLQKDTATTYLDRLLSGEPNEVSHAHIVFYNGKYTLWIGRENEPSFKGISSYELTPYWFPEAVDELIDFVTLQEKVAADSVKFLHQRI